MFGVKRKNYQAFSLAEMMVVMLIISIVLAALAPLITTRMRNSSASSNNLVWHWVNPESNDAFTMASQAMIGQSAATEGDDLAKLILNSTDDNENHILFKRNGNISGRLKLINNSILLGTTIDDAEVGSKAVAIGIQAKAKGGQGIAIGYQANAPEARNLSESSNVAIGALAMANSSDTSSNYSNVAIGHEAMYTTNGGNNVGIGYRSMLNNDNGSDNTAIGVLSLRDNVSGKYNTAVGEYACSTVTGSNKTCIGEGSGVSSNKEWLKDDKERIFIGGPSNFNGGIAVLEVHNDNSTSKYKGNSISNTGVVINGNLIVKGITITQGGGVHDENWNGKQDNRVVVVGSSGEKNLMKGNCDTGEPYLKQYAEDGGFGVKTSDRRLKNISGENNVGLSVIRKMQVYNYTFLNDENKIPQIGVMAQDLQKILPEAVKKNDDGFLKIRLDDILFSLVNAVKELDDKVTQIFTVQKRHDDELKELRQENEILKKRLDKLEKFLK